MYILIVSLAAVFALLLLPRFFGRKQDLVAQQYEILEKRFGLIRKVTSSRWGKGIGERVSLTGSFRGYPISLYEHFHGKGRSRIDWTSLAMEVLFADDLELRIRFPGTKTDEAFAEIPAGSEIANEAEYRISVNRPDTASDLLTAAIRERLATLGNGADAGAISLSKGFLEYRELGSLTDDTKRARFQSALLLLADLADAISVYLNRN